MCVRVYVCVCVHAWGHVCEDSIIMKKKALYCRACAHTQSHRGDDWALVMLCKFSVGEDLLSITEGMEASQG